VDTATLLSAAAANPSVTVMGRIIGFALRARLRREASSGRGRHFIRLWHDRHTHFPVGMPH
jgi:hypothetical protein